MEAISPAFLRCDGRAKMRLGRYPCGVARIFGRLLVLLLLAGLSVLQGHAAEPSVGMVTRAENDAQVISAGSSIAARVGTVLHLKDELRTGADARLQVTFRDNTTLTLGERAIVVIDRYVFDPEQDSGEAALEATKGAIRFATGRLKGLSNRTITVATPVASLGVRGTEFWSGPLGVLLLKPAINVSNQGGSVILSVAGQGTFIQSQLTAPTAPAMWSAAQIAEALAMTDFQAPPGQQPDQNGPNQQKGGQNGTPPQNQQYALSGYTPLVLATLPVIGFLSSTLSDEDRPASP